MADEPSAAALEEVEQRSVQPAPRCQLLRHATRCQLRRVKRALSVFPTETPANAVVCGGEGGQQIKCTACPPPRPPPPPPALLVTLACCLPPPATRAPHPRICTFVRICAYLYVFVRITPHIWWRITLPHNPSCPPTHPSSPPAGPPRAQAGGAFGRARSRRGGVLRVRTETPPFVRPETHPLSVEKRFPSPSRNASLLRRETLPFSVEKRLPLSRNASLDKPAFLFFFFKTVTVVVKL